MAEYKLVAASAHLFVSAYKILIFRIYPGTPMFFFRLNCFLWKSLQAIKIRKKFIDQIFGYTSLDFEIRENLGHLFAQSLRVKTNLIADFI